VGVQVERGVHTALELGTAHPVEYLFQYCYLLSYSAPRECGDRVGVENLMHSSHQLRGLTCVKFSISSDPMRIFPPSEHYPHRSG
jgi:hypothetical protein